MSSSDIDSITFWNNASLAINRYLSMFIFLFGIIGNILNILVLSQKKLRRNPCSQLFLASSAVNIIAIISGLTTRMLSGWAVDLTNTINWLCKFRTFVVFVSRNLAPWFLFLATVDRWLLSSTKAHRRHLSTMKNAYRGMAIIIVFSIILFSPTIYCYEANLKNTPLKCYGATNICRLSNDISFALGTIIIPILLMFVFGLLTIFNIAQAKSHIQPTHTIELHNIDNSSAVTEAAAASRKKFDQRLFFMLSIQVILLSLFTLPQGVQKLYSSLILNQNQSLLQTAMNNFIFNLFLLLTYVANGMPFYIYTLTGGTFFRNGIKDLIKKLIH